MLYNRSAGGFFKNLLTWCFSSSPAVEMSIGPLEEVCSIINVEEYEMFSVVLFFFSGWTS